MRSKKISIGLAAVLASCAAISLLAATRAAAQTEKVLYSFSGNLANPVTGVIFGAGGSLYGTVFGGASGSIAFELTPSGSGVWTESVLYNLPNGIDVASASALVADASGNLYGTTASGGDYDGGTVFELTPATGGGWTEKILHSFSTSGKDGYFPPGGLIFDGKGNLYGTTEWGGTGNGTVFELTPSANGNWTEKILHAFSTNGEDGNNPNASLVIDGAGNLFGTTTYGGTGYGTAFELTPAAGGRWKEKMLHRFSNNGKDGYWPSAGLVFDANGNLYGITPWGGYFGGSGGGTGGTAFELTPSADGGWGEKILHNFGNGENGSVADGMTVDTSGNLYGVTVTGGMRKGGAVYELSPSAGGKWSEKILYSFGDSGNNDGTSPRGTLTFDSAGNVYGTTYGGGANGQGTVFEVTP